MSNVLHNEEGRDRDFHIANFDRACGGAAVRICCLCDTGRGKAKQQ